MNKTPSWKTILNILLFLVTIFSLCSCSSYKNIDDSVNVKTTEIDLLVATMYRKSYTLIEEPYHLTRIQFGKVLSKGLNETYSLHKEKVYNSGNGLIQRKIIYRRKGVVEITYDEGKRKTKEILSSETRDIW